MQAVIHTSYPAEDPPSHPGHLWTRFVCISDTHSHVFPVPPGDVLLHAGDLSSWGSHRQLVVTVDWLKTLPHEHKIVIAGNHDLSLDLKWRGGEADPSAELLDPEEVDASRELMKKRQVCDAGIHYLENQALEITTSRGTKWKVYGSPAAPQYALGAFQYVQGIGGKAVWSRIPTDVEILLTHTPPYAVLDLTRKGKYAGCLELATRLENLEQCRLHVFGHIHESRGAKIIKRGTKGEGCVSVNAALANGGQAIIVDLKKA